MVTFKINLELIEEVDPSDLWEYSLSQLVDISDAEVQSIEEL